MRFTGSHSHESSERASTAAPLNRALAPTKRRGPRILVVAWTGIPPRDRASVDAGPNGAQECRVHLRGRCLSPCPMRVCQLDLGSSPCRTSANRGAEDHGGANQLRGPRPESTSPIPECDGAQPEKIGNRKCSRSGETKHCYYFKFRLGKLRCQDHPILSGRFSGKMRMVGVESADPSPQRRQGWPLPALRARLAAAKLIDMQARSFTLYYRRSADRRGNDRGTLFPTQNLRPALPILMDDIPFSLVESQIWR
jgi:hypothetical protein